MTKKTTLHGRMVSAGVAEGEALVTNKPLSLHAGAIANETGFVRIQDHPLSGHCIKDKILIYDTDYYTTGATLSLYTKKTVFNSAPAGIIWRKAHGIGASGAIYSGIPAVHKIEEGKPWEFIETGDWVKIDANRGVIEVTKRT
jgi:predicted aconitase with swiveling domain